MNKENKEKMWFIPITKKQMMIRIIFYLIILSGYLLYFWYVGLVHLLHELTTTIVIVLALSYLIIDVLEYLQTGKVIWRRMGPDVPMKGLEAKFYVALNVLVLVSLLVLPFHI